MRISTPQELRKAVSRILCDRPDPAQVRSYFDFTLRLAQAHLRHSRSQFRFRSEVGINSLSDLALDSISDLFERNQAGVYVRLRSYYESIDHCNSSDMELWSATRRLISSAVSDAVFRNYRSADPSLAKIIRNIKRGISMRNGLELVSRIGCTVITPIESKQPSGQEWTVENMSAMLLPALRERHNISIALTRLEHIFEVETRFSDSIRLSEFALAIRNCCVVLNETESHVTAEPDLFSQEELDTLLEASLSKSLLSRKSFYVSKGKLTDEEFDCIVNAIRIRLQASISEDSENGHSNYDAFRQAFPEVSHETYRAEYRNVFEYFHRMALDTFIEHARVWSSRLAS